MGKLKPCPFCGKEVVIVKNENPRLYRPIKNGECAVFCGECNLLFGYDVDYGGQFDSEEDAIEAWNTRAKLMEKGE